MLSVGPTLIVVVMFISGGGVVGGVVGGDVDCIGYVYLDFALVLVVFVFVGCFVFYFGYCLYCRHWLS